MEINSISYLIIGCCYTVYNNLGPDLLESVYEEALAYELSKSKLKVNKQLEVPIMYDGKELKTPLRLDLLIEDSIIIELKSVEELKKVHLNN